MSAPLPSRDQESSADQPSPSPRGVSRRRLLRAGAGAAPVVLSMTSLPVNATAYSCRAASSWASFNARSPAQTSYSTDVLQSCDASSPAAWSNCALVKTDLGTLFKNIFASDLSNAADQNKTLKQVCALYGSSNADSKLAAHLAAAYLNIKNSKTTTLTETAVKTMWTSCKGGGTYTVPNAGTTAWSRTDVVTFLQQIMLNSTV